MTKKFQFGLIHYYLNLRENEDGDVTHTNANIFLSCNNNKTSRPKVQHNKNGQ